MATVDVVVNGRDNTGPAFGSAKTNADSYKRSLTEVGDTTDDLATKSGTAAGAFGALGSGLELVGLEGSAAAAGLQAGALATDFFSGVTDFATLALQSSAIAKAKDAAATVVQATVQKTAAAATKAWAAVQWVLNAALAANPIGLIIVAIAALVAGIILAYKNSETFRKIVQAAFNGVKTAGLAMWNSLKLAFNGIKVVASALWSGLKAGFSALKSALAGYASAITAPYRAAFAGIRAAWNSTVGGKGFSVPGWIPGVGGKSFRIPYFANGGVMGSSGLAIMGERGRELVGTAPGSRIRSNGMTERALAGAGGGGMVQVNLVVDGRTLATAMIDPFRKVIKNKGGNVQKALGS